jgi:tetratricopeptide (TPR) repeat protein
LHIAGIKKSNAGDTEAAIANYRQALTLDPHRPDTLYNLGLIHKYRGAWRESLDCNSRADALQPGLPDDFFRHFAVRH